MGTGTKFGLLMLLALAAGAMPANASAGPPLAPSVSTVPRPDATASAPRLGVMVGAVVDGQPRPLAGGSGRDRLVGGGASDLLEGGSGADSLIGGAGRDLLIGGPGRDKLNGGNGRDSCKGGGGRDTAI